MGLCDAASLKSSRLVIVMGLISLMSLMMCSSVVHALDNGLARTPPMGWLAWERFRCNLDCKDDPNNCISQQLFTSMADRLVADGYADAGYVFVNIDDCWMAPERDAQGRIQADPDRFPNGIAALAQYMHDRKLKLGLYADFGLQTCAGYPGTEGHIDIDMDTFASWEIDMLKVDGCHANVSDMATGYPNISIALNATGRPIVYSCSWPFYLFANGLTPDYNVIARYCNLWRLYYDVQDSWDSVLNIIDYWGSNSDTLQPHARPGQWNDMDMLIIGNSLTPGQSRAQFAIWSVLASPLLMSNDLRNISQDAKLILLNKEVIAVDQDPLGMQGRRYVKQGDSEVWARELVDGQMAVVLFNRAQQPAVISFSYNDIGFPSSCASVRDLFQHMDMGSVCKGYSAIVAANDVVMLTLTPGSTPIEIASLSAWLF